MEALEVVRIGLAFVATGVYSLVGVVVGRRAVSDESRVANRAFQAWWFGLAIITLYTPLNYLLDAVNLGAHGYYFLARLFIFLFLIVGIVVAIGSLVYYLLYVYTGRPGIFWPVAIYHYLLLIFLMLLIVWAHPVSFGPVPDGPNPVDCEPRAICMENSLQGSPASRWLGLSIILPILLSAIAYFGLYFRVDGREQKYRIAMVAGAIVFWFGSSLVASFVPGTFETVGGLVEETTLNRWVFWTQIISPSISLSAALAVLMAYRPPGWIRARIQAQATGG